MHLVNSALSALGSEWPDLASALLGAVVGAAASAIPAYLLASKASAETLRRDQLARTEADQARAFQLLMRLSFVANELETFRRQIEGQVAKAEAARGTANPLWTRILPFVGVTHKPAEFQLEGIALLYAAKEPALANKVLLLERRHEVDQLILLEFSQLRRSVGNELGGDLQGTVGKIVVADAMRRCGPRLIELETLAQQLRVTINTDAEDAIRLLTQVGDALGKHFGKPAMFEFRTDDLDEAAA